MLNQDKFEKTLKTVESVSANGRTTLVLIYGILMALVALVALLK